VGAGKEKQGALDRDGLGWCARSIYEVTFEESFAWVTHWVPLYDLHPRHLPLHFLTMEAWPMTITAMWTTTHPC
jgi:hypothetical protein